MGSPKFPRTIFGMAQKIRDSEASHDATTGLMKGFSTQEMADRVASVLGPVGMHDGHARLKPLSPQNG